MSNLILSKFFSVFVDELITCGVESVVMSPGSRSTPLAMLFYARKDIQCYMNIDERSAGFFALGLAKSSRKPTVLICTSGSAAANYYPAIVEANLARVPLIVITADRPPYLQGVGAAQTMHQDMLYSNHVRHFESLPLASEHEGELVKMRNIAYKLYEVAQTEQGVVHINAPIEEEMMPTIKSEFYEYSRGEKRITSQKACIEPSQFQLESLKELIEGKKVLFVVGFEDGANYHESLVRFCEKNRVVLLADPLSNVRSFDYVGIIKTYDAFLTYEDNTLQADIIVRLGAFPLSKRFLLYCQKHKIPQIVIDPLSTHRNPIRTTVLEILADEEAVLEWLYQQSFNFDTTFFNRWIEHESIQKKYFKAVESVESIYEGRFMGELVKRCKNIFVSSSMSVRYLDYFYCDSHSVKIYCNRGVNGIDGTFSSALGVATTHAKRGEKSVLVTGDLAFIHDMNGMILAKTHELSLVVVLFNNDGGGIFNYLPQSQTKDFNYLFTTQHGLDIGSIVRGYGHTHCEIQGYAHFIEMFEQAQRREGVIILEIKTDREESVEITRQLIRGDR